MDSAVALRYPKDKEAPVIAAKETGYLARRMVQIAQENNIPVVQDQMLESVLSVQEIGQCIPEHTWYAVAAIFASIARMEKDRGKV